MFFFDLYRHIARGKFGSRLSPKPGWAEDVSMLAVDHLGRHSLLI